jgi:hypothetical protein
MLFHYPNYWAGQQHHNNWNVRKYHQNTPSINHVKSQLIYLEKEKNKKKNWKEKFETSLTTVWRWLSHLRKLFRGGSIFLMFFRYIYFFNWVEKNLRPGKIKLSWVEKKLSRAKYDFLKRKKGKKFSIYLSLGKQLPLLVCHGSIKHATKRRTYIHS